MNDPLELLKLKNGGEAPAAAVWATMTSLKAMMTSGLPSMFAVIELADHVRRDKRIPDATRALLVQRGLMEPDGSIHDIVRDVILSAAQGEGVSFALVSPVVKL